MRSWYLDDMHLVVGDKVICKGNIAQTNMTMGKTYTCTPRDVGCSTGPVMGILNDNGAWCIPSARFQKV